MAVIGVLSTIAFFLIGLPGALFLGLLAGLLSFVPYLGPVLAFVPPLLVAPTVSPTTVLLVPRWGESIDLVRPLFLPYYPPRSRLPRRCSGRVRFLRRRGDAHARNPDGSRPRRPKTPTKKTDLRPSRLPAPEGAAHRL